jgi:hypothetical protein
MIWQGRGRAHFAAFDRGDDGCLRCGAAFTVSRHVRSKVSATVAKLAKAIAGTSAGAGYFLSRTYNP